MATCASEDSNSLPKPAGDGNSDHSACEVRCFVHNVADDDVDAESTIRSLLEPHVSVRHCQHSTAGLSRISRPTLSDHTVCRALYPPIRPLQPSVTRCVVTHQQMFMPDCPNIKGAPVHDFSLGHHRRTENRGRRPTAGGVLGKGQKAPSPPATGSGERYELPQWGSGGAQTAQRFSTIFSNQDALS